MDCCLVQVRVVLSYVSLIKPHRLLMFVGRNNKRYVLGFRRGAVLPSTATRHGSDTRTGNNFGLNLSPVPHNTVDTE